MYMEDIKNYYGTTRKAAHAMEISTQRFSQMQHEELAPEKTAALLHCWTEGRQQNGLRLRYKKELYGRE